MVWVYSVWQQKQWELPDRAGVSLGKGPPQGAGDEAGGGPTGWVWGGGVVVVELVVGFVVGRMVGGHDEPSEALWPRSQQATKTSGGPAVRSHKTGNPFVRVVRPPLESLGQQGSRPI